MRLLVIVPSRLERDSSGRLFLAKALDAIAAQQLSSAPGSGLDIAVKISIGVDPGAVLPTDLTLPEHAGVSHAAARSQASALNAAAEALDHDFVAILEDDDRWLPGHLETSLRALHERELDFVSSTQLQIDEKGNVASIFDFPTPSGWVMRRAVWQSVGPFDTSYRYHLDNEWLGRLAARGFRRGHLVECTAPLDPRWMSVRPWLHHVLTNGGPRSTLLRHDQPAPLVHRMVHAGSGMSAVANDSKARSTSQQEYERLARTYGRIPW
jgi:hypothetical protein